METRSDKGAARSMGGAAFDLWSLRGDGFPRRFFLWIRHHAAVDLSFDVGR